MTRNSDHNKCVFKSTKIFTDYNYGWINARCWRRLVFVCRIAEDREHEKSLGIVSLTVKHVRAAPPHMHDVIILQ